MIVIISPHFDDAIFSVGGILIQSQKFVNIVTVCGGIPSASKNISSWDKRCNFDSGIQAALARQQEDKNVFKKFKAEFKHLTFEDFPYSGQKDELSILNALEINLSDVEEIWAPIGIGQHPDHLSSRNAATEYAKKNKITIKFYADAPYASAQGWDTLDFKRASAFQWVSCFKELEKNNLKINHFEVSRLNEELFLKKTELVNCYHSQLDALKTYYPNLVTLNGELSVEGLWTCTFS